MRDSEIPPSLEHFSKRCIEEIVRHEDFDHFVNWMKLELSDPKKNEESGMPPDLGEAAAALAFNLWNATPLPGNEFTPKPIPMPKRNEKCFCGSGKKFKKCCLPFMGIMEPPDTEMMLPLVMDILSPAKYNKLQKEDKLPFKARFSHAVNLSEEERFDEVVTMLEDWYLAPTFSNTGKESAFALHLLMDAYDKLGLQPKKLAVLDHIIKKAPASPLRAEALQRLALVQADKGNMQAAHATLAEARKDDPNNALNGMLEIQLLLLEEKYDTAKQRAVFIRKQILRQVKKSRDIEKFDLLLDFLDAVIADPQTAMENNFGFDSDVDDDEFWDWFEEQCTRPAVASECEELDNFPPDPDTPGQGRPHYCLAVDPQIEKLEFAWRNVCPIEPLFGTQMQPHGPDDVWEGETAQQWMDFLYNHPQALDSLLIVDDLLAMCQLHPDWEDPDFKLTDYSALLQRGIDLAEATIETLPASACLPWSFSVNRPLFRILLHEYFDAVLMAYDEDAQDVMLQILRLNPVDNHGFRETVMNQLLLEGENEEALDLAAQYSDDILAGTLYGRVLALYRLGRMDEALAAAHKAKEELPQVATYLTSARKSEPPEDPYGGVIQGGKRQAWEYREEMRNVWKRARGILTWLKKA